MENGCVFCDRNKFAESIITENDDWYVIATLGQIIGGYVLIIPKKHVPCLGALVSASPGLGPQLTSFIKIREEVGRALSQEYYGFMSPCRITAFEHGVVGQTIKHAHLHLLPAEMDLTSRIHADFPAARFEEVDYMAQLQELYQQRQWPYLFWTAPSGRSMICWDPPTPPEYLRLATAELLGYPERGSWRKMDPELDKKLRRETIARLRPHFSGSP